MEPLFAVAWMLTAEICPDHRCTTFERAMSNRIACEKRAERLLELAPPFRSVRITCPPIRVKELPV